MAKMTSEVKQLTDALLRLLPDRPKGPTPEQKEMRRKQKALHAATFKTKRFAHYIVGRQGAYAEGKSYKEGEVIRLPVDQLPSHTFQAVDRDGVAVAELEAKRKARELEESAGSAADEPGLDADELELDRRAAAIAEDDEETSVEEDVEAAEADVDEEPEVKPAPTRPARAARPPKVKPTPPKGKAGKKKGARASDQDVA